MDMGTIKLNLNFTSGVTLISNNFIDHFLPQADGSYVKVYLYLLRCLQAGIDNTGISDIADILETSERDILRAITYWEKNNLISVEKDSMGDICGISLESDTKDNNSDKAPINTETNEVNDFVEEAPTTASDSIIPLEALLDDDNFVAMQIIIERMLERPINSIESNLIINLYVQYHFKPDLIVHLFEYCLANNKASSSMIEKIGMEWANNGIDSVEKANNHSLEYSDVLYKVINAFGIKNRTLGSSEKDYIIKWTSDFCYNADIITAACSKTLSITHQPSFEYTDKIISEWHNKNVKSLKDIEVLDRKHKEQKLNAAHKPVTNMNNTRKVKSVSNFNFEQRAYSDKDYESLEKRALSKYLND